MKNEISHYESHISWEGGNPTLVYKEMITKEVLEDLPLMAMSMPYIRTDKEVFLGLDSAFEGMTNAEVANIRLATSAARGSLEAFKSLQDRVLGKPKQQIESRSITETYTQYLERISDEVPIKEAEASIF